MTDAEATVEIDLTAVSPGQARALLQQVGAQQAGACQLGKLVQGHDTRKQIGSVDVHLTAEEALTMLTQLGVLNDGEEANDE